MNDDSTLSFRFYGLVVLLSFCSLLFLVVGGVVVDRLSKLNRKLHRIESHVRRLAHIAETHFPMEGESQKNEKGVHET